MWTHQSLARGRRWPLRLLRLRAANIERRLEVNLQHFPQQNSILVLNLLQAFSFLQFFFVVVLDVIGFGRLAHVNLRLDISESLHMHEVLFDLLALRDDSIRSLFDPHY